jgi:DNA-binding HxlR family transcriptional regulator
MRRRYPFHTGIFKGTEAKMGLAYNVMAPTCPSRVVLHRIGARWTIFVVTALAGGSMRFSELKRYIEGITPKVLTSTLQALVDDGLVQRTDSVGNPPRVDYELTPLGQSLLGPLGAVREWAETHVPDILDARERSLS